MALGQLTLGIPGATATTFATTPIPAVVLFRSPAGSPLASRSPLGYAEVAGRSNRGTAQVSGAQTIVTYVWAVATMMTKAEAQRLTKLANWQDWGYKGITNTGAPAAKQDRPMRLIDETEELDGEPSPHSRTLLTPLTDPDNAAWVYGYGVFSVKIQLPEDWRQQIGVWASGAEARLCTFSLVEL
jgi:hypothetical protein